MITKETLITWYDSREEQPKAGEGILVCIVPDGKYKGVIKASGVYDAKKNTLHFVNLSDYPWYMWCKLDEISPWKEVLEQER